MLFNWNIIGKVINLLIHSAINSTLPSLNWNISFISLVTVYPCKIYVGLTWLRCTQARASKVQTLHHIFKVLHSSVNFAVIPFQSCSLSSINAWTCRQWETIVKAQLVLPHITGQWQQASGINTKFDANRYLVWHQQKQAMMVSF